MPIHRPLLVAWLGLMLVGIIACDTDDTGATDPVPDASQSDTDAASPDVADVDGAHHEDADVLLDARPDGDDGPDAASMPDSPDSDTAEHDGGEDASEEDAGCNLACPQGQTRCEADGTLSTCQTDALGCAVWSTPRSCPDGERCDGGVCVPRCTDADTRCTDALTLQRCEGGRVLVESCPGGCDIAARACAACPSGAWRCLEAGQRFRLERCQAGTWVLEDLCDQCGCQDGTPVTMTCPFARDPTPTTCLECTPDGTTCLP